MILHARLIPLPAMCALTIAACGASTPTDTAALGSRSTSEIARLSAWRSAVACARQHGMAGLPDPELTARGTVTLPGVPQTPVPTPIVLSACGSKIRAIESPETASAPERASDIRALVKVAACLRVHGYPRWPDPNVYGEFRVRSADAGTPARFHRGISACKSLFPPSGWHLTVTPSGH